MSSQVTANSNVTSPPTPPPAFTSRPKQDPVGMSALFVAVTVVCALGASSILISTRDGGSGLAGAFDSLLNTVTRIGPPAANPDHTASITVRPEAVPVPSSGPALAPAPPPATGEDIARINDELSSLKNAVAEVKSDVSTVKTIVRQQSADDQMMIASSVAAAVEPVKSELNVLAASLAATHEDIIALQTRAGTAAAWLDQTTSAHLHDIQAIYRRIGKVEDLIRLQADMTASIPPRVAVPLPPKRPHRSLWTAQETQTGSLLLKGPTGTYEIRGASVVPGLGRVDLARGADGRLRLLTGRQASAVR